MYFLNSFPLCAQIIFKITKETGTDQFFLPSFLRSVSGKAKNNIILSSVIYEFFKYYRTAIHAYSDSFDHNEKDKDIMFSLIVAYYHKYNLDSYEKNFFNEFVVLAKAYRKSEEQVISDFISFCEDIVNEYENSEFKFNQGNVDSLNGVYKNAKMLISYLENLEGRSQKFSAAKNEMESNRQRIFNKNVGAKPDYKFGSKAFKKENMSGRGYNNRSNDFVNVLVKIKNDYRSDDISYIEWARNIWIKCENSDRERIIETVTKQGLVKNGLSNECAVIIFYLFKDYFIRAENLRDDMELEHLALQFAEPMARITYAISVQYGEENPKGFNKYLRGFIQNYIEKYNDDRNAQKDSVSRDIFYSVKGFQRIGDLMHRM